MIKLSIEEDEIIMESFVMSTISGIRNETEIVDYAVDCSNVCVDYNNDEVKQHIKDLFKDFKKNKLVG